MEDIQQELQNQPQEGSSYQHTDFDLDGTGPSSPKKPCLPEQETFRSAIFNPGVNREKMKYHKLFKEMEQGQIKNALSSQPEWTYGQPNANTSTPGPSKSQLPQITEKRGPSKPSQSPTTEKTSLELLEEEYFRETQKELPPDLPAPPSINEVYEDEAEEPDGEEADAEEANNKEEDQNLNYTQFNNEHIEDPMPEPEEEMPEPTGQEVVIVPGEPHLDGQIVDPNGQNEQAEKSIGQIPN